MLQLFQSNGNPVIRHKYTADPTAIVCNEQVYLYTGHDEAPAGTASYVMNDWLCFSSANMRDWKEHACPLKATDFAWVKKNAFASKVIQHRNRFYWFVAVTHAATETTAIGVAVAEDPAGPFADALGKPLVTHDMLPPTANEKANLDPSVIIAGDGRPYLFWGHSACYYARLKDDLCSLDSDIQTIPLPGFTEGSHLHIRNGWYYLSYGYGYPEKVAYAMSRSIRGPWEFKGILNEIAGNCATNRPAIIDFKDQSYFIYHNGALQDGGSHRRSVCIDYLYYNDDDTMKRVVMTTEGVQPLKNKV